MSPTYQEHHDRSSKPLGARIPEDKPYVDKYPLSALPAGEIPCVPITIGINWYTNFDNPVLKDSRYWIGLDPNHLGSIRGGHCLCVKSRNHTDLLSWWAFYDQGSEGACVGFGSSRMMTLMNRKRYDARWLWDIAKTLDSWSDTNPGDDNGTSVDAGMQVMKAKGHVPWSASYAGRTWQQRDVEVAVAGEGVSAYRWATTVDEVRAVLQSPLNDTLQAVPLLNSWGTSYSHITWLPYATLERLIKEDGEVSLVTDR